ncbi:MAG TPA: hypothetical protein VGX96_14725 [Candidatus Elarobacter sp.]|nr:hypothetical protein [Candidatus Elarobacter sp.]
MKALWPAASCHSGPPQQVNIVFDKTKPYSATQAHSIDRTLVEMLTVAADNAEINLYYITSDPEHPSLVLNVCKPATRGNVFFNDVSEQQRQFRLSVVKKVKHFIDAHYQRSGAAPIIESLATIARQRIVTAKLEQHVDVQFDIYSDMVQDSKGKSLSGVPASCGPQDAATSRFRDTYGDVSQFFRDVPVHVYGIHREAAQWPRYPGERCVRAFWEPTFPHLTWMTI